MLKSLLFSSGILLVSFLALAEPGNPISPGHNVSASPLLFTENRGQVADANGKQRPDILFTAQSNGATIFLTATGIHYQFQKTIFPQGYEQDFRRVEDLVRQNELARQITTETDRLTLLLDGANPHPKVRKEQRSAYTENFYLGHCPDGITGVHTYSRIVIEDVYPGIDWVVYSYNKGMEYDFIVHSGADPSKIKLKVSDARSIQINEKGSLCLSGTLGAVQEAKPVSFCSGQKVATSFHQNDDSTIGFEVGSWDKTQTLTIDPMVSWATYFGGNNYDWFNACVTDKDGKVYASGYTNSNTGIATSGGFQTTYGGGFDVILAQYDKNGTPQWATYYGGINTTGVSPEDYVYSCAADKSGNVYVSGFTGSNANFATAYAHQTTYGGSGDAFLAKFSNSGIRLWATYYGGFVGETGNACATDDSGNVFLAGHTTSSDGIATPNAYQTIYGGGSSDPFVVKFNGNGVRQWGTYFGGSGNSEYCYACATDKSGNVCIAGHIRSLSGIASAGSHQTTYGGGDMDAFLVKFSGNGNRLWSTYYGGAGTESIYSCATDDSNHIFIGGITESSNNIATAGSHQAIFGGYFDAFAAKFSSNGVREWGTYYGGTGADGAYACTADSIGDVYFTGFTNSLTGVASLDAYQKNFGGGNGYDAFLVKLNNSSQRQWGTYFGGNRDDYGKGCAVDKQGAVYLAGYAASLSGIATPNGYQDTTAGGWDAYLAKFGADEPATSVVGLLQATGSIKVAPNPVPSMVTITNTNPVLNATPGIIVNLLGQEIHRFFLSEKQQIDVSGWTSGIYFLRFVNGETIRLVKF